MTETGATPPLVLVVEDSGLMAMEIEAALADSGYHPVVAATVSEAESAVQAMGFVCALLDFRLGDDDCLAVALALEQQGVPVAIISGYDVAVEAPELARFTSFRKPVGAAALVRWVDAVLGRDEAGFAAGTNRV